MKLIHRINGKDEHIYNNVINKLEKSDNKYEFFLDNILNSIYITDRLIFKRKSDEYIFLLEIYDSSKCSIELISENKVFDIDVKNAKYDYNDKEIIIEYELDTEDNEKHTIILEIEE